MYLQKDDPAGNTLYRTLLGEETTSAPKEGQNVLELIPDETVKWLGINAGAADREGYQILNNRGSILRLWRIERCEQALDRQTVRVGVLERMVTSNGVTPIQELAAEFNYSGALYQVELVPYSTDAILQGTLQMELIKGDGPDVLELLSLFLSRNDLADNGVFEDLNGYLDRSKTLGREDILPRILEAGSYGDQLISLIPQFGISTNVVRRGYTENGGWTVEDFLDYCAEYPEAPVYQIKTTRYGVLGSLIRTNFSRYVDREGQHRIDVRPFRRNDFGGMVFVIYKIQTPLIFPCIPSTLLSPPCCLNALEC